jgi:peptidoglycan hydrolase-like protein with peptidoglycan-binding domain
MKRTAAVTAGAVLGALAIALPAAGMGKPRVAALQVGLQSKGLYAGTIDGVWGPATARGVRRLQRHAKIAVDGVPGLQTRRALGRLGRHRYGSRVLRDGDVGWDVTQVQFLLAWHGFPSGTFDGGFGPRTRAAVRRFQRFAGLGIDGAPGPATYRALAGPIPRSPIRLVWPLGIQPTDRFGPRGNRFHAGIDFPADRGVRVRAAGRGRIVKAGWTAGGHGRVVIIRHPRRTYSWYAHLARVAVRRGQWVTAGKPLGTVGATGRATGPHLHFEVRVRGAAVDPLTALR